MAAWTDAELRRIEDAQEFEIAPVRRDGAPRERRPIWMVRVGDDLYVRAAYGSSSGCTAPHGPAARRESGPAVSRIPQDVG